MLYDKEDLTGGWELAKPKFEWMLERSKGELYMDNVHASGMCAHHGNLFFHNKGWEKKKNDSFPFLKPHLDWFQIFCVVFENVVEMEILLKPCFKKKCHCCDHSDPSESSHSQRAKPQNCEQMKTVCLIWKILMEHTLFTTGIDVVAQTDWLHS